MTKLHNIVQLQLEQEILARAQMRTGFFGRLRGLLATGLPEEGTAVILECRNQSRLLAAVHTIGMRYDIAVFWLDAEGIVVDRRLARPWRLACIPKQAAMYVVEAAPALLDRVAVGDRLKLSEVVA